MFDWLALIGGTIATLLPIANPFSTAPVFASLTLNHSEQERKRQAWLAAIYMTGVLLVTLFVGAMVLTFYGIGTPGLRIAGGLLIARVGFSMVNPQQEEPVSGKSKSEAIQKQDIAFTPIAMPLLSGPGSMATVLTMASVTDAPMEYASIAAGICIVAFISWLVLRSSTVVADLLGVTGMIALTRVMGLLLVCVAIQFISTGVIEGLTDPRIMKPIGEAVQKASQ